MSAAYDKYDYISYWKGREYEHGSEVIAIKAFLERIPKIDTILEVGAGFARLAPYYLYRARKAILTDPSSKLLKFARNKYSSQKKVVFIQSSLENLPKHVRSASIDLILMVRVLHHLSDIKKAFANVHRLLRPNGYFILEFANKSNLKSTLREFFRGNLTFPLDLTTKDISTHKKRKRALPFLNYHPDLIKLRLEEAGFKIVEIRSVSNIRSPFLKRIIPLKTLLSLSELMQRPFSYFNFGPSIFVLAKKEA